MLDNKQAIDPCDVDGAVSFGGGGGGVGSDHIYSDVNHKMTTAALVCGASSYVLASPAPPQAKVVAGVVAVIACNAFGSEYGKHN